MGVRDGQDEGCQLRCLKDQANKRNEPSGLARDIKECGD